MTTPSTADAPDADQPGTDDAAPVINLCGLSPRERQRLRVLARRYRVRQDTTLRPVADVMFDLRLRHGVQLDMGQVLELVSGKNEPGVFLKRQNQGR